MDAIEYWSRYRRLPLSLCHEQRFCNCNSNLNSKHFDICFCKCYICWLIQIFHNEQLVMLSEHAIFYYYSVKQTGLKHLITQESHSLWVTDTRMPKTLPDPVDVACSVAKFKIAYDAVPWRGFQWCARLALITSPFGVMPGQKSDLFYVGRYGFPVYIAAVVTWVTRCSRSKL